MFSENHKPLAKHGWVWDDFQKAVQQASVAPLQFRVFRRTFGTQQALMGTQEKIIRELLGHKTSWMVQRYIRVVQSMRKDAVDKLGEKLGPITTQQAITGTVINETVESDVRQ